LFLSDALRRFTGLDNAGKTTLLYKLKHGVVKSFVPTQRALVETFVRLLTKTSSAATVDACITGAAICSGLATCTSPLATLAVRRARWA
jgi:hypothetical protein